MRSYRQIHARLRPASEARSGSFAKLPPDSWPPLRAISRLLFIHRSEATIGSIRVLIRHPCLLLVSTILQTRARNIRSKTLDCFSFTFDTARSSFRLSKSTQRRSLSRAKRTLLVLCRPSLWRGFWRGGAFPSEASVIILRPNLREATMAKNLSQNRDLSPVDKPVLRHGRVRADGRSRFKEARGCRRKLQGGDERYRE